MKLNSLILACRFGAIGACGFFGGASATGAEPSVVFDNRPESGIPEEALAQERVDPNGKGSIVELVGDSIKTIRVRYFNHQTWADEKQAGAYVTGLLADKNTQCYTFQIWSQGVGTPEMECTLEFTNAFREKLLAEHQPYHEGKLLVWRTEACLRDASGKWWFVNVFDYFHSHHPGGDRKLSREKTEP